MAVFGVLTAIGSCLIAEDPAIGVADFIQENCVACHDAGNTEGDLDLEALAMNLEDPDNFHSWERIYDRVRTGEMPPEEELDESEKKSFVSALGKTLFVADAKHTMDLGRVSARRLTRAQVERYTRSSDSTWEYASAESPEDVLKLDSIGVEILLKDIYAKVKFKPEDDDEGPLKVIEERYPYGVPG